MYALPPRGAGRAAGTARTPGYPPLTDAGRAARHLAANPIIQSPPGPLGVYAVGAVQIYVTDQAGIHLSKEAVTARITYFWYMGEKYSLDVTLQPSKTTPVFWGFTSSLSAVYGVRIEATGYTPRDVEVSLPVDTIKEYTFKLSPSAEPPAPGEAVFPWMLIPQAIAAAALILL